MPYKAVLFDMDGTLVDSVVDVADSMNRVLTQNNLPVHAVDDYICLIGNGMENLVTKALPADKRNQEFIKKCLAEMKAIYAESWMNKTQLFPGIAELLTSLQALQIRLAVLSNKPDHLARIMAEKLMGEWHFDVVMGAREGIPPKPDPAAALVIANQLGLLPSGILYLGDTATDMETAVLAGMFPVGVSWGYRSVAELLDAGASAIINSPSELLDKISG
jgi:phosphoglycolate phosphatase